jgi:hypothetical protein
MFVLTAPRSTPLESWWLLRICDFNVSMESVPINVLTENFLFCPSTTYCIFMLLLLLKFVGMTYAGIDGTFLIDRQ